MYVYYVVWEEVFYLIQLSDTLLDKRFIMQRSGIFNLLSSSEPWHGAVATHAGSTSPAVKIYNKYKQYINTILTHWNTSILLLDNETNYHVIRIQKIASQKCMNGKANYTLIKLVIYNETLFLFYNLL